MQFGGIQSRVFSGALLIVALTLVHGGPATAQTMGFATLPPGTLNHTTASAISKVLKDKGGINMLVQPTAGDQVINPMVGRGEVETKRVEPERTQGDPGGGEQDRPAQPRPRDAPRHHAINQHDRGEDRGVLVHGASGGRRASAPRNQ